MEKTEECRADLGTSEDEVAAMVRRSFIRQDEQYDAKAQLAFIEPRDGIPLAERLAEYKVHVGMMLVDLANLTVGAAPSLVDLSSAE